MVTQIVAQTRQKQRLFPKYIYFLVCPICVISVCERKKSKNDKIFYFFILHACKVLRSVSRVISVAKEKRYKVYKNSIFHSFDRTGFASCDLRFGTKQ